MRVSERFCPNGAGGFHNCESVVLFVLRMSLCTVGGALLIQNARDRVPFEHFGSLVVDIDCRFLTNHGDCLLFESSFP